MTTGYPFIDRPWLKYYDKEAVHLKPPTGTITDFLYSCIDGYGSFTALTYFGKEISYRQLKRNIETARRALYDIGVRQGDRVLLLMPNIPETAYSFYALASLGAISDFIDPRPGSLDPSVNKDRLVSIIEDEKPRYIIVLEQLCPILLKPVESDLWGLGIQGVAIVSVSDSMGLLPRMIYKIKGGKVRKTDLLNGDANVIARHLKELLCKTNESASYHPEISSEDTVAIVHTSGTSGKPKPIPLTHKNLNSYVLQTMHANMNISPGDKVLHLLPYFAAFGLVGVVHAGFCHINNLVEIPEFVPDSIPSMLITHKPQIVIGVPSWFMALPQSSQLSNANMNFFKMITYGGDSMSVKDESRVNEFLLAHGCQHTLTKGHGLSEVCGCSTYAINGYNTPESCGIPLPMTTYAIVDPETKELMPFKDGKAEGEIAISSPSVTPGFIDGVYVADIREIEGEKYLLTGDLASIDKNGIVSFLQRNDRTFARFDGFKVRPAVIERCVEDFCVFEKCVAFPYVLESHFGHSIAAALFVPGAYTAGVDEKIKTVKSLLNHLVSIGLSSREIPTRFYFREKAPVAKSGKLDYGAIKELAHQNDYVLVEIEETNLHATAFRVSWTKDVRPGVAVKSEVSTEEAACE